MAELVRIVVRSRPIRVVVEQRPYRVNVSGARGESAADVARRLLAAPPYEVPDAGGMSDEDALEALFGAPQSFLPETVSWILAVEAQGQTPTYGRMLLKDELIRRLLAMGADDWCEGVYVACESLEATATNLLHPGTVSTVVGSPGFLADRWVEGAADAKIETNIAIPGALFTQSSAFLLARQVSATLEDQNRLIGTVGGKVYVTGGTDQNHVRAQANAAASDDSVGSIPNGYGDFGWIRRNATEFQFMVGGVPAGTVTRDSASIVVAGNQMLLMAGGAQFASGRAAYWAFGSGITDDQYAELAGALEWYLGEIGGAI